MLPAPLSTGSMQLSLQADGSALAPAVVPFTFSSVTAEVRKAAPVAGSSLGGTSIVMWLEGFSVVENVDEVVVLFGSAKVVIQTPTPSNLNPPPSTLNPQPSTLNPKP